MTRTVDISLPFNTFWLIASISYKDVKLTNMLSATVEVSTVIRNHIFFQIVSTFFANLYYLTLMPAHILWFPALALYDYMRNFITYYAAFTLNKVCNDYISPNPRTLTCSFQTEYLVMNRGDVQAFREGGLQG